MIPGAEDRSRNASPLARAEAELHLTDLELDDVLIGDSSPAADRHLSACASCRGRLAALEQPLASFRAVSLAWSERRSATLPLGDLRAPVGSWGRRLGWAGAVLAAALVVAISVPGHDRPRPAPQAAGPAAAVAAPAAMAEASPSAEELRRQKEIEADNRMLAAIDQELESSQAMLAAYGVNASSSDSGADVRSAAPGRAADSTLQD